MKSYFTKTLAIILLVGVFSCNKDDLRQYDALQQKDAVENLNDAYLLSSIIKKSSLFYQDMGWGQSKLPGAVQYTMRNYQGGDNTYQGFKQLPTDMYTAMDILKLIAEKATIVGCDICELAPIPGFDAPNHTAARIAYEVITEIL